MVARKGQAAAPAVFNVLKGEAVQTRSTAFGEVGTLFSDEGIELVWVSKGDEDVDPDWFCSDEVDLIVVVPVVSSSSSNPRPLGTCPRSRGRSCPPFEYPVPRLPMAAPLQRSDDLLGGLSDRQVTPELN